MPHLPFPAFTFDFYWFELCIKPNPSCSTLAESKVSFDDEGGRERPFASGCLSPCKYMDMGSMCNFIKAIISFFKYETFISSVRSSSGDHGLIEIQQQQQGHFSKFSNLEQSCLYTFIIHFHFHSVFNVPNRTRQYFCMNYIDNAFKFLQDSTRFFRFL